MSEAAKNPATSSEQETTRIVSLLEDLRRDSPELRGRVDPVVDQTTDSVDPHAVFYVLQGTVDSAPPTEKS